MIYKELYVPAVKVLGSQAMINEVLGVQLTDLHTNKAYKPFTKGWSKEDPRQAVGEDMGAHPEI